MKIIKSKKKGEETSRLLSIIAKILEKISVEDLANFLLKNEVNITKTATNSEPETLNKGLDTSGVRNTDLSSIAETLLSLNSRDEGNSLLASKTLSRKELEALGKVLGTPILKTDNMSRLTQKIIEASIGSRLNSKAIRGNDS
ncbi:MAG: hypothetical protein HOP21_09335 [Methylotenera sp.]|nr:hypothetical protein [Methylotenera sp.]